MKTLPNQKLTTARTRARLASMQPRLPIGTSDFSNLRRQGLHYVDKSMLAAEIVRNPAAVILLPRPRRFGKTLNLSMLSAFFERTTEDRSDLFSDLAVWQAGDDVRCHFARYPVIYVTFKDVKCSDWTACVREIGVLVGDLARAHEQAIRSVLTDSERDFFAELLKLEPRRTVVGTSLRRISEWLHRATGDQVVILIDEYDTPLHAAWQNGYWDEAVELFRGLLGAAFKDNRHLFKGVLTGILRVAKESIFSGLNNLEVRSMLSPEFAEYFGFSQAEVQALALACEAEGSLPELERWYNGYRFGGITTYNPWSVLMFLKSRDRIFRPYWVETASNDLLRDILIEHATLAQQDLEIVLSGGIVRKEINENVVLREIRRSPDALWSFLLFCGYLKAQNIDVVVGRTFVDLAVPNLEVQSALRILFSEALVRGVGDSDRVRGLCNALLVGDVKTFGRELGQLLAAAMSYHDLGGAQPEKVYQAFVVGLLVAMDATHEVRSNRESGYGRCDVLIAPRQAGQPGVAMELKVVDKEEDETVETALDSALAQLRDRDYAQALRERGADPVREMAVVFDGKRAWVRLE